MEYTITKEKVDAIHATLYELNIPCKTKDAIIKALTEKPVEKTEPKSE